MMARDRRNRDGIIYYAVVVLVGVALAWVIAQVVALQDTAEEGREDRDVLIEDVRVLRDQIEDLGQTPAAPEPEERVAEDPPPPVSDERLDAAVQRFCGLPGCRGPRGFPGADSVVPGPRGPRGEPGESITGPEGPVGPSGESIVGPQGEPGPAGESVAGPQGPPGESITGPPGPTGSDGADGEDGRGIVDWWVEGDLRECEMVIEFDQPPLEERRPINGLVCPRPSEE